MSLINVINVWQVKEMLDEAAATIVDSRDLMSYQGGHIPTAIHLTGKHIKSFLSETDKEKPVVVYCYQGNSSKGTAAYLSEHGFKEVYSMTGGFDRWVETYTDIEWCEK